MYFCLASALYFLEGELPYPAERAIRLPGASDSRIRKPIPPLRWSTRHVLEALESAGMTLQDLLAKHAIPRLEARKGIYIKHRGQITRRLEVEDSDAQLDLAVLLGHVLGMYPDD